MTAKLEYAQSVIDRLYATHKRTLIKMLEADSQSHDKLQELLDRYQSLRAARTILDTATRSPIPTTDGDDGVVDQAELEGDLAKILGEKTSPMAFIRGNKPSAIASGT